MAVQAWFSHSNVPVAPGTVTVLKLTVVNLGDVAETYSIAPVGLAAGWTTIRPAAVTLFGGSQEAVDVEVRPPLISSTPAGPTDLTVRIVPQTDPDGVATSETTLDIGASNDRRLRILQPAIRARRKATFEVMLENHGNTQASCRLHLLDPTGRVEGDFDPPAVGVEPGGSTLIRLKMRARRRLWQRRSRTIAFVVDADQVGMPGASAPATFIQAPVLPERLFSRLFAVLATAGVLTGAWFAVARPAIDRSAQRAVAKLVPATTTTVAGTPASGPVTSTTTATGATTPPGTGFSQLLKVSVGQGLTDTDSLTVPAGQRLDVTDLIAQNPGLDKGNLQVLKGDGVLYSLSLEQVFLPTPLSTYTAITLQPGERLSFQVTCSSVGDASVGACTPAVLVVGTLRPA